MNRIITRLAIDCEDKRQSSFHGCDLSGESLAEMLGFFLFDINCIFITMDALDIISLEQAKEFLVVDFPDRDAEITRHIKSAISYVENYTNIMTYERSKSYQLTRCSLEIYDAPISFITNGLKTRQNVLSVTVNGKEGDVINTTVGYSDVTEIPSDLIEGAYKVLTYLFENKDIYSASLPWDIQLLLNPLRRSATII